MITIITGSRNASKTAYIKNLVQGKDNAYGYISEKIMEENEVVGYHIKNVVTGSKEVLIHQTLQFKNQFLNCRFHFDLDGFTRCCKDLIHASQRYDTIIMDEIGKLELEEKLGFYSALQALMKKEVDIVLTIRDIFLPKMIAFLEDYKKQYEVIKLKSVGAIIMASGESKRFKEGNKLLYTYKGYTLFERVLKNVIESSCFSEVVVVSKYEEIEKICEKYKEVTYLFNERAIEGISSSIQLGTAYLKDKVDGYMYIQADQIFIKPSTFSKLVKGFNEYEAEVIVPKFGEKTGSPRIISATLTRELLRLTGDEGGKAIIRGCNSIINIAIENEEELLDIDTLEDFPK